MRIGKIAVKRRVWVGLVSAVGVIGVWWSWTQGSPPVRKVTVGAKPPFVRLAGAGAGAADQVLREQADLFDPTPIFFPTQWNYGQRSLPERLRRPPGQVFGSFEPIYIFTEQSLKLFGAETTPPPEKLSDILTQGNEAPFAGIGQIDVSGPILPERGGFLEVNGLADGKSIVSEALNGVNLPGPDYAPLEFLVVISSAGVIGQPVLISGSGREGIDGFFSSYLVKTFRLGERLMPGRYRVLIGP